jgi:hypothetical protein
VSAVLVKKIKFCEESNSERFCGRLVSDARPPLETISSWASFPAPLHERAQAVTHQTKHKDSSQNVQRDTVKSSVPVVTVGRSANPRRERDNIADDG